MPSFPLILLFLFPFAVCYDFNLTGPQDKLLTWVNSLGVQQNLLLSQISVQKRTLLVQRATLPYDYETDEECKLTESLPNATLYEPNAQKIVAIEYTHMQGNQIMSKNTIQLSNDVSIKLTEEFTVKLSNDPFTSTQSSQPEQNQPQNKSLPLYLYNNESLLQIEAKIYSPQPACYMLSRMTQRLCLEQSCGTLSPLQLYDMEVGPIIKNFSLINNLITIPSNSTNALIDNVVFGQIVFTISGDQIASSVKVTQSSITLSGNTLLTVKFVASKVIVQDSQAKLRKVTDSSSLSHQYNVNILVTNPKQVYAIKTINLYKGKEIILSDRLIIKPSQTLSYDTQWNGDTTNLPAVEILNEKLEFQGKYSLNFEITDLKTEEHIFEQSNQQIIPETFVEELTISQTHDNRLTLIIGIASGAGSFLLLVILAWLCRKRIAKKCLQTKEKPQLSGKKETQVEKNQSSRPINIQPDFEITFEKKPSAIVSLPTASTLHRQSIYDSQSTPKKEQELECSIKKELPVFSKETSQIIPEQKGSTISRNSVQPKEKSKSHRSKSQDMKSRDESLSTSSKWDESCTQKRLTKKKTMQKEKDQEHTEKI